MAQHAEDEKRLEAVMEFNDLYGDYSRDIEAMLVEIGLAAADVSVLRRMRFARDGATSAWLRITFGLDAGQLSRSLRMLEAHDVVTLKREKPDTRYLQVRLTRDGEWTLGIIDDRLRDVARRLLRPCDDQERADIVAAMRALSGILRHRRHSPPENALVPFHIPRLRRAD